MNLVSEKKILTGYKHRPGPSCAASTWSGLMRYQGYEIDQTDFFGIGCGHMYTYAAVPSIKQFNMPIVSNNMVPDFLTNVGLNGVASSFKDNDRALDQILKCIDAGMPVAVKLNPQFSENLVEGTRPEHLDFLAMHWIVIVGYDLEKEVLILFDSAKLTALEIKISDFKRGRNSGNFDQNPQNFFYTVTYPKELLPMETSMLSSLRKTTFKFFHVEKHNNLSLYSGQYGYEKAIRHIGIWNKMLDPASLEFTIAMLKITLTVSGSTKGAYRYTFAEYLKKCAHIMQLDQLLDVEAHFRTSAEHWIDYVATLDLVLQDSKNPEFWGKNSLLAKKLKHIYAEELKGFEILNAIINT